MIPAVDRSALAAAIPRFFVHVRSTGHCWSYDEYGLDFPDVETAHDLIGVFAARGQDSRTIPSRSRMKQARSCCTCHSRRSSFEIVDGFSQSSGRLTVPYWGRPACGFSVWAWSTTPVGSTGSSVDPTARRKIKRQEKPFNRPNCAVSYIRAIEITAVVSDDGFGQTDCRVLRDHCWISAAVMTNHRVPPSEVVSRERSTPAPIVLAGRGQTLRPGYIHLGVAKEIARPCAIAASLRSGHSGGRS
jgi:hypothetical protein